MPRRKTRDPIATIAALTPMVVALRMPTLFTESMRHGGAGPETSRAVSEKLAAMTESVVEMQADALKKGERVVVVDDLLATGGTAAAALELIKKLGGDPLSVLFLIELEFLGGRAKLGDTPEFAF